MSGADKKEYAEKPGIPSPEENGGRVHASPEPGAAEQTMARLSEQTTARIEMASARSGDPELGGYPRAQDVN